MSVPLPAKWAKEYGPLAYDGAYVLAWAVLETGTQSVSSPGVWALITLFGFYFLCLCLDYSINFQIGEGQDGILKQMGISMNGCVELLLLMPFFMAFVFAMAFPVFCVHEALIQWHSPAGVDDPAFDGAPSLFFAFLGFFTVYMTFNVGNVFRGRQRWNGDVGFYRWVVPLVCLVVGAAVGIWSDAVIQREGMDEDTAIVVAVYIYLPMRYLITRTVGVSGVSVLGAVCALLLVHLAGRL